MDNLFIDKEIKKLEGLLKKIDRVKSAIKELQDALEDLGCRQ